MGWDAYATKNGEILELSQLGNEPGDGLILTNTNLRLAFWDAMKIVADRVGNVDGMLKLGGLDCSVCAQAIDRYGGFDPWTRDDLTPEQVRVVVRDWKKPQWETWVSLSAYMFLKTCADNGLGVHFSW